MAEVEIPSGKAKIKGMLTVPPGAKGVVIFAHGSGSSRFSPRNQFVAAELQKAKIGTLLIDLLTEEEEAVDEQTGELRFNVPFLAKRLSDATVWVKKNVKNLSIGYFGASTGAAAALVAACSQDVRAVVSRGGRPDLAMDYLAKVKAPVLLIVGGDDTEVIEMNKTALKKLACEKKLEIVPGATHLFEEPGALERVAKLAVKWFKTNF